MRLNGNDYVVVVIIIIIVSVLELTIDEVGELAARWRVEAHGGDGAVVSAPLWALAGGCGRGQLSGSRPVWVAGWQVGHGMGRPE